jgi:probable F420-dependent oxidoreductase
MAQSLRFGVVFPTNDIGDDPIAMRDYAQAAEALGFDHLITYDHVLGAEHADREPPLTGPYDEDTPFHEPFVLFGYLAAQTRSIELVIGVLVLPQRQTALVAKQAAEVALLSGGRLRLGVGTGWNWVEYDSLGVPFAARGRRLEEQVDVLRRLWSEPVLTFHGEYHDIERAGILPQPRQSVPIWFGGSAEPQLRRAARLGDGFLTTRAEESARKVVERLRGHLAEQHVERDFTIAGMVDWAAGPDAVAATAAAWREAGGTHLALRAFDTLATRLELPQLGYTTVDQHLDAMRSFADLVGLRAIG